MIARDLRVPTAPWGRQFEMRRVGLVGAQQPERAAQISRGRVPGASSASSVGTLPGIVGVDHDVAVAIVGDALTTRTRWCQA